MFRKKPEKVVVTLSSYELRYARNAMVYWYNKLIEQGKPTEDVEALICKLSI